MSSLLAHAPEEVAPCLPAPKHAVIVRSLSEVPALVVRSLSEVPALAGFPRVPTASDSVRG
jgi:hypothetical protein